MKTEDDVSCTMPDTVVKEKKRNTCCCGKKRMTSESQAKAEHKDAKVNHE